MFRLLPAGASAGGGEAYACETVHYIGSSRLDHTLFLEMMLIFRCFMSMRMGARMSMGAVRHARGLPLCS